MTDDEGMEENEGVTSWTAVAKRLERVVVVGGRVLVNEGTGARRMDALRGRAFEEDGTSDGLGGRVFVQEGTSDEGAVCRVFIEESTSDEGARGLDVLGVRLLAENNISDEGAWWLEEQGGRVFEGARGVMPGGTVFVE